MAQSMADHLSGIKTRIDHYPPKGFLNGYYMAGL